MTLIQLLLIGLCAAAGLGALLVGNCLEALLIFMVPIGYYAITKWRKVRKARNEDFLKRKAESEAFWEKERELRAAHNKAYLDGRDREDERRNQYRQYQQNQMSMMHQNAMAQAAAQRQAAMNRPNPFGYMDPRQTYGSDLADNIVNLWAINSMLNQPSAVHAATASPAGPAIVDAPKEPVTTDPIQFHSFVNSSLESSSSSSSYSSDTSSDSFGGSDTSSDSF